MEPIPFGLLTSGFAAGCVVALAVTFLAALLRTGALQVFGASAFVFVMFFASLGVSSEMGPPRSMAHYPLQDLTMLFLLWITWGRKPEIWKWVVGGILLAQLGFHAGYWALFVGGDVTRSTLRGYILLNNIGMAAILSALSVTGGFHVYRARRDLADLYRRWSVLPVGHRPPDHGAPA